MTIHKLVSSKSIPLSDTNMKILDVNYLLNILNISTEMQQQKMVALESQIPLVTLKTEHKQTKNSNVKLLQWLM
jgi:hypothetical protein